MYTTSGEVGTKFISNAAHRTVPGVCKYTGSFIDFLVIVILFVMTSIRGAIINNCILIENTFKPSFFMSLFSSELHDLHGCNVIVDVPVVTETPKGAVVVPDEHCKSGDAHS